MVGNYPGGGFDIYARAVARHLGRNIPGNPTVVVKNMPGAGSAKAGVHISTVAPKDGLSIGAVTPGAIVGPLLDDKPQSMFDPAKVTYLGTANSGTRICVTYDKSKVRSFKQAMTEKIVLGGVAPGDAVHDFAYMVRATTGAAISVVPGYKGTLDVDAGDGAPRGRRRLRLGMVERQGAEAGMDPRRQAQLPVADRPARRTTN